MKIRVSNLASETTKADIHHLFGAFGGVDSIKIFRTPGSGSALAFVIMDSEDEALQAVSYLEGQEFKGAILDVAFSQDKIIAKKPKAASVPLDLESEDELVNQIEEPVNMEKEEAETKEVEEEFTWDSADDLEDDEENESSKKKKSRTSH